MAFASDPERGDVLLVGGEQSIRLWRLTAGQALLGGTLRKHTAALQTLAVAPDGSGRFASGGDDGRVLLWNLTREAQLSEIVAQKFGATEALAISPDGRWLADAGTDAVITVRDVSTDTVNGTGDSTTAGQTLAAPLPDSLTVVRSLDFHPDASRALLAAGDESGYLTLWHVREAPAGSAAEAGLDLVWSSRAHGETTSISRVVFDPDPTRNRLLSAGNDGRVLLWTLPDELAPSSVVTQSLLLQLQSVFDVEFNSSGDQIAVASEREFLESQITLWAIRGSEAISLSQPLPYRVPVRSMDLHPAGRFLVAGYDEEAGRSDSEFFAASSAVDSAAAAATPAGVTLDEAMQIFGQQAIVWDIQESEWERALSRHTDGVLATAFSPDGELLVTASRDRTLILWDVESWRALGQPIATPAGEISALAFDPTGRVLYTAGDDTQILRWAVEVAAWRERACRLANRALDETERRIYQIDSEAGPVCE